MNDQIPCIDCITYPICKAQWPTHDKRRQTITSIIFLYLNKCSLLHEYIYTYTDTEDHLNKIYKTLETLKPKKEKWIPKSRVSIV